MDLEALSLIPPWDWPADADDTLLAVLRDRAADPSQREVAAELAGETTVMNDAVAQTLVAILRDPAEPDGLRGRAAIALGPTLEQAYMDDDWDDPDDQLVSPAVLAAIRDSLHRAYRDPAVPRDVRRRALEGSIRYPDGWHEGAARAAYHSGDDAWKLTAVFCMRWVDGFEPEILESLESEAPEVRFEAVRAAGSHEIDAAWPHLTAILRSERDDRPLLFAAIEAAGNIRPGELREALGDLLASADEEIADVVAETLGMADVFAEMEEAMDEEDDEPTPRGFR